MFFFLENPGSGTYQVEDKTIEKTLKDKLEKDEDVLKKKPAFSSSLSRFTDLPKGTTKIKKIKENNKFYYFF